MFNRKMLTIGSKKPRPTEYWAGVQYDVQEGLGPTKYPLGTTLQVVSNSQVSGGITWEVASYDTQWDVAGKCTHTMTLLSTKGVKSMVFFNTDNQSGIKYSNSNPYNWFNGDFTTGMDASFLAVVQTCNVKCFEITSNYEDWWRATGTKYTVSQKFWLPSWNEMGFVQNEANPAKDDSVPFTYYAGIGNGNNSKRIKTTGSYHFWWLRTPWGYDASDDELRWSERAVYEKGGNTCNYVTNRYYPYLVPACIIG